MALTKAEMAERLFEEVGLNKREAKEFVDAFFDTLRDGLEPRGLEVVPAAEFVVERIGSDSGHAFQDAGVEYYRYVS